MPLPEPSLRLAIATAIVDGMSADTVVEKLFREDPEKVLRVYDEITTNRLRVQEPMSEYGRRSERSKLRPLPSRKRKGLRVPEMAARAGLSVATMTALLEHHGFLELVPLGGNQRRRLVTNEAFNAGLGHNVTPANRIGKVEGYNRAAVFPVFYPERLGDILWCLGFDGIKAAVSALPTKRERLAWLLEHHPYLPDAEIASLSGYTRRSVISARSRRISQASHKGDRRGAA